MIANTLRLFILSKKLLDRYLFLFVCVSWFVMVMEIIFQEKFILLDRFQWFFKICFLRINLWSKKYVFAYEFGFEKKEKKLICRNLQNFYYLKNILYLDIIFVNSSQLVLFFGKKDYYMF